MEIRSISSAAALKVALIAIGVTVALRFLWIAHAIFIVTFLGILLGLAMARAVDYLEKIKIRRGLGAPLVLVTLIGLAIGLGALIGPSLRDQTKQLTTELPKAMEQVEHWINQTPAKALVQQHLPPEGPQQQPQQKQQSPQGQPQQPQQQGQEQQQQQGGLTAQIGRELRNATKFLFPIITSVFGAIGGLVIVLFLAMYIAATPGLYREGLRHLIPHRHRDRGDDLLDALRDTLRQWLIARAMAMVIIGLVTGGALALLGVKGAGALGVLAGIMEFVPFFGPVISAIPAIGIALVDSPQKALWVIGLYLFVQQLEGNVVTPLLLEKRLDIPPVLTVVAVSALGVVFGVLGMLIAEPLLAAVLVTTKLLYVQDVVGDEVKLGHEKE
ncbi:MAG TPA: AI-2E family transporter [Thermoanaerobaculia bacterium]|nr:AI-2E family transporter [Thermoanaerobaculia bacterium]